MNILEQIQKDILDESISLSTVLRKAKVLAYEIDSDELKLWVKSELDGYENNDDLPGYRILESHPCGKWTNGYHLISNHQVPMYKIEDEDLVEYLTTLHVCDGIRTIEVNAKNEGYILFESNVTTLVNMQIKEEGWGYAELHHGVSKYNFEQMVDTIRNRLQDFILELGEKWKVEDEVPEKEVVEQIFNLYIHNPEGVNVGTIFDQKNQNVNYQFNAAGNIDFSQVNNVGGLVTELEKIKIEIGLMKDGGVITDAYEEQSKKYVDEAIKEAAKKKPNGSKYTKYIGKAKDLFTDVKGAVGVVTALIKAAEIAKDLL